MSVEIEQKTIQNILVVKILTPRFVAPDALTLRSKMEQFGPEHTRVVLDLSGVHFVDSIGVGSILNCFRFFEEKGEMVLCSPSKSVGNLLGMTGLNTVIRIFPDQDSAVAALQ